MSNKVSDFDESDKINESNPSSSEKGQKTKKGKKIREFIPYRFFTVVLTLSSVFFFFAPYRDINPFPPMKEVAFVVDDFQNPDTYAFTFGLMQFWEKENHVRMYRYDKPEFILPNDNQQRKLQEAPFKLKKRKQKLIELQIQKEKEAAAGIPQDPTLEEVRQRDVIVYHGRDENLLKKLLTLEKKVIVIHDDFYLNDLRRNLSVNYFSALRKADMIIDFVPDELFLFNKAGYDNIIYMPKFLPIEVERAKPTNLTHQNIFLLENDGKSLSGTILGIKAMEKVVKEFPNALLQIFPNYVQRDIPEMEEMVKKMGLEKNVFFVTFIFQPKDYMKNASALVVPTIGQASPYLVLESKRYGLPTIITEKEYMDSCKEGCIHVKENPDDLANEIIKILKDKKYREEQGNLARKSTEKYFDADHIKKWEKILNDSLQGKPGRFIRKHFSQPSNLLSEKIMMKEFELFKQSDVSFKCLQFHDLLGPLKGKKLKNCLA